MPTGYCWFLPICLATTKHRISSSPGSRRHEITDLKQREKRPILLLGRSMNICWVFNIFLGESYNPILLRDPGE